MRILLATILLVIASDPCLAQNSVDDIMSALRKGTFNADFRLRHEMISEDGKDENAQATTLRSVLGYRTSAFRSLTAYLEMEAVADPIDNYNNAAGNGKNSYPVVADPNGAEANQAYLRCSREGTSITLGRQEIVTGQARFVGNVGWRQNHQSFDAVRLTSTRLEPVDLSYAYLDRVHRIFGDDVALQGHVGRVSVPIRDLGTVAGFAQAQDYEFVPEMSTQTFGAEASGSIEANEVLRILYTASFAKQQDAFDNPQTVDATYSFFRLGIRRGSWTVAAAQETLGGDPQDGRFTTPLATLHKFNGWADRFLGTPANGLVDRFVTVAISRGDLSATAVYHDYSSDSGNVSYGSEIDLQVIYSVIDRPVAGIKLARYLADSHSTDITKLWLWTSLRI